jgi:hypothetical protein
MYVKVWCDDEYDQTFNNDMMVQQSTKYEKKKCIIEKFSDTW